MYSEMVMDIVNVLEEHLMDEWQLEDYAAKIGYSKFHLTHALKKRDRYDHRGIYTKAKARNGSPIFTAF